MHSEKWGISPQSPYASFDPKYLHMPPGLHLLLPRVQGRQQHRDVLGVVHGVSLSEMSNVLGFDKLEVHKPQRCW